MHPEVGQQPVPGYRLTQPLGEGAFAQVWEARREDDGALVALKFLDCRARSATMIANEVKLLRALSAVKHPNIIPLLAIQPSSRYLLLIMERADGSIADLHAAYRRQTGKNFPAAHALDLLDQAASALDFLATAKLSVMAGQKALQHCDVKPSNLLLVGTKLKVADFGLCAGAGSTSHTGWKGTRPYAAPELYNGSAVVGTDQYALAITYVQLVVGERAFWPGSLSTDRPPAGPPIDLTKLRESEYPIVAKALHAHPSMRWPTCRDFVSALRRAIELPRTGTTSRIHPRGLSGTLRIQAVREAAGMSG